MSSKAAFSRRLARRANIKSEPLLDAGSQKGNLSVFIDGHKSCLDQHTDCKRPYLKNIQLTHRRVTTSIGIVNDPGHDEPWFIAMSGKPGYLNTRDYAARWGIEPMFSNFQSRGFGLEQKQLQTPDRLSRLMLVLSLALYFAVATGQWDAVANFTVDEQIAQSSAEKPDPRPLVLVHQRTRRIVRMVTFGLPLPPLWPSG